MALLYWHTVAMTKKKYYTTIAVTFLTAVFLSFIWEFWLETPVLGLFVKDHKPESLSERWEYIITITSFVSLSLIYPTVIGGRLVARQNEQYDQIKRLAEYDHLTGVFNRRAITEELATETRRSAQSGHIFSIILLDVDGFKEINDEYGHIVGDQMLVELSEVMRNTFRSGDIIGRWGGEEFIVVCPRTDSDGALFLAEKLRKNIDGKKFTVVGNKTASVGVAEYQLNDDAESIIVRADEAMYTAKRQGRNRIVRAAA